MTPVAQIPLKNTLVNPNTCLNATKILAFMGTLTDSSLSLRNCAVQTTWKQEGLLCRTWSLLLVDWSNSTCISSGSGPRALWVCNFEGSCPRSSLLLAQAWVTAILQVLLLLSHSHLANKLQRLRLPDYSCVLWKCGFYIEVAWSNISVILQSQ